jgi:pimeloyl-ACP methyl ester carboxylesterase
VIRAQWTELVEAIADPDPARRVQRFFAAAGLTSQVPAPLPRHCSTSRPSCSRCVSPGTFLWTCRRCGPRHPKTVVSGGHHDAYERLADRLAETIGADHVVLPGAGHAVQDTGEPFNALLRKVWLHPG